MSERKENNNGAQKPRQSDGKKREYSLPPTTAKPPMPSVKPPKKK